jgi:DNA-binding transcriptional ArsR family regulator
MDTEQGLISEERASLVAEFFSAFSDSTRLRIISLLTRQEMNVREISQTIGISHSACSHQLKNLRQMRLVKMRKEGRKVYYNLDDIHIIEIFEAGVNHVYHGDSVFISPNQFHTVNGLK